MFTTSRVECAEHLQDQTLIVPCTRSIRQDFFGTLCDQYYPRALIGYSNSSKSSSPLPSRRQKIFRRSSARLVKSICLIKVRSLTPLPLSPWTTTDPCWLRIGICIYSFANCVVEIMRKIGELFLLRTNINSVGSVLDSPVRTTLIM